MITDYPPVGPDPTAEAAVQGAPVYVGLTAQAAVHSHRRWPRVVVTLVILALVVALVAAYSDDTSNRSGAAARIAALSSTNQDLQGRIESLQSQNDQLAAKANHPSVGLWNSCNGPCTITPNGWRAGGVPDTFTYHLVFTSNAPIAYAFLTLPEYVRFNECPSYVHANNPSINRLVAGCINYWIFNNSPPLDRIGTGQSVNYDFHLAEGCGDYVVMELPLYAGQTATMNPNISVTYQPASTPTGTCASQ